MPTAFALAPVPPSLLPCTLIRANAGGYGGTERGSLAPRASTLGAAAQQGSSLAVTAAGYQIHRLTGDRKGAYAIAISGRWRIVFHFQDGNVDDVEVVDCHRS